MAEEVLLVTNHNYVSVLVILSIYGFFFAILKNVTNPVRLRS